MSNIIRSDTTTRGESDCSHRRTFSLAALRQLLVTPASLLLRDHDPVAQGVVQKNEGLRYSPAWIAYGRWSLPFRPGYRSRRRSRPVAEVCPRFPSE
jgi:hypothetical protein